jgi:hypothetical protein
MSAVVVPFTSDQFRTFNCALNGVAYDFSTNYNDRNGVWSFDMADHATGAPIISGVPILIGCDLLAPYGLGIGSMFAVDLAAAPAAASIGLTWTQAQIAGVALTSVGPVNQPVDADPVGAFANDLGTRVIVVYVAPAGVQT